MCSSSPLSLQPLDCAIYIACPWDLTLILSTNLPVLQDPGPLLHRTGLAQTSSKSRSQLRELGLKDVTLQVWNSWSLCLSSPLGYTFMPLLNVWVPLVPPCLSHTTVFCGLCAVRQTLVIPWKEGNGSNTPA